MSSTVLEKAPKLNSASENTSWFRMMHQKKRVKQLWEVEWKVNEEVILTASCLRHRMRTERYGAERSEPAAAELEHTSSPTSTAREHKLMPRRVPLAALAAGPLSLARCREGQEYSGRSLPPLPLMAYGARGRRVRGKEEDRRRRRGARPARISGGSISAARARAVHRSRNRGSRNAEVYKYSFAFFVIF